MTYSKKSMTPPPPLPFLSTPGLDWLGLGWMDWAGLERNRNGGST